MRGPGLASAGARPAQDTGQGTAAGGAGAHLCVPPVLVTVPLLPLALPQQVAVLLSDERRSGHTENNV